MKLTNEQLKQIIREELEVVLTNEEAGEIFGDKVQRQLEEDEAKVEEACAAHGEEPPPREPADIVMALEKAMRALGDALDYMRGEHEDALGDVAGDMADQAAVLNVGPMHEVRGELKKGENGLRYFDGPDLTREINSIISSTLKSYNSEGEFRDNLMNILVKRVKKGHHEDTVATAAHDIIRGRAVKNLQEYVKEEVWPKDVGTLDWTTYGTGPKEHYQTTLMELWRKAHDEAEPATEWRHERYSEMAAAAKAAAAERMSGN